MARRAGNSVRSRRLAFILRRLRGASGHGIEAVGRAVGMSGSKINRIERMESGVYRDDLERLLDFYEVSAGHRVELLDIARRAEERGWLRLSNANLPEDWQTWLDFEQEATTLLRYQPLVIPGLLQTPEYASAIIRATGGAITETEVDALVSSRMARQGLLHRTDPLTLHAIIEENVLRHSFGKLGAHGRQLRALADATIKSRVTIQVLPAKSKLHSGLNGPFTILKYDDEPSLVLLENKVASLFLDEDEHVKIYSRSWTELQRLSLSPKKSIELIADLAERL
ncbi:helix-turn-helix domain-containing protein [Solihabitans fulvus]|uniref:helix-turn-helix domain-containing protein n=1 Tax=Solihabitans fulvus TaxID=1892852 RepID=UPI001661DCC2|nr:helix-turn-helix transcriptional regulator [Solihabitans fulvus]